MTWVKLDDTCPDHPSILGLSDAAFACWVRSLCYASRHLTDGHIPRAALRGLGTPKSARELVSAGRWEPVPDGWRIHGYTEKQRTREQVEQERSRWRDRQDRHRGVTPESRDVSRRDSNGVTRTEVEERQKTPPTPAQRGPDSSAAHTGQHPNCRACRTNPRALGANPRGPVVDPDRRPSVPDAVDVIAAHAVPPEEVAPMPDDLRDRLRRTQRAAS